MPTLQIGQRRLSSPPSWTLVDGFSRDRRNRGEFPTPIGKLRVLLEAQEVNAQFREIDPPVEARYTTSLSGVLVLSMQTAPEAGSASPRLAIPPGRYRIRVVSDFYQEAVFDADLVEGARLASPALLPGYAYPFPYSSRLDQGRGLTLLRGALHSADGKGVADAEVTVVGPVNLAPPPNQWPFRSYGTDKSGQWVVIVPEEVNFPPPPQGETDRTLLLTVRFDLPSGTQIDLTDVPVVQGRETGLTQTAIRGFVRTTQGRPLAGAVIEVAGEPGQAKSGPSGDWVFYFELDRASGSVVVTATLPDGISQNQSHAVVARTITTAPTFVFT